MRVFSHPDHTEHRWFELGPDRWFIGANVADAEHTRQHIPCLERTLVDLREDLPAGTVRSE